MTYVPFKRSTGSFGLTSLNANDLRNVNVRFERLLNAKIISDTEIKVVTGITRTLLLKLVAN